MPRNLRPAAFLDRDGTIIRQVELLHQPEEVRFLPGAAQAIRLLNDSLISVIVVTNQPVVARGIASETDVEHIHELMNYRLRRRSARIDAFFFCPHHPHATIDSWRQSCACRKPNPGMILNAADTYGIALDRSVMIGDTTQDVLAGTRAGVSTILVRTGHGGRDLWQYPCQPDMVANNLLDAVTMWLERMKR